MIGKRILKELSAYKQGMQIKDVKDKYDLDKIVKLASNENPYGYSEKVDAYLQGTEYNFAFYPDGYSAILRYKLAEKLNVHPEQIVFGSGSDEVITFICRAFLSEGTNTVMASPTFPQYRHHALIEGAEIKEIATLPDGGHDLTKMGEAIDEKTKVVWLCVPDNPTGTFISYEQFKQFMKTCPEDVVVVLDEAYYEFVDENLRYPFQEVLKSYPNVIMLRTFSKIYGLAGLRVGYAVSKKEIAEKLNVVRGPFNTTALSQHIAAVALEDDEFVKNTRELNKRVRSSFEKFLQSIGWEYYESHTNFLLVKTPRDADVIANKLLQNGFIVRSGTFLGYPNTIRITIGTEEDMLHLQQVIEKINNE